MKSEIKTAIVLVVVIGAAIAGIQGVLVSLDDAAPATDAALTAAPPTETSASDSPAQPKIDKSRFKTAPEIVGIFEYINTTPDGLEEAIKDKVVLYDIWTYSCINCIRTLPYITAWDDKYADEGLLIVGVHSPEFEFEKNPDNVRMAVEKYGIKYPVVMDNEMDTWKAFENRYWPRKYVADHEGYIRYDKIGEGGYDDTERVIQNLLRERAASLGLQTAAAEPLVDIKSFEHTLVRTPELYFGYQFAFGRNQLGSEEGFKPESIVEYGEPKSIDLDKFYMTGEWKNRSDSMELVSDTGRIQLYYNAKEVNIVTENAAELKVTIDGKPVPADLAGSDIMPGGLVSVSGPDLYNLVSADSASTHLMQIDVSGQGFQIFTFTFG
ncbi:MAG: thiol-disulfide isomerase [Nitrosopumilus sp. H8]|nr:MAG: thiol-disulfide isomerase [Nitrosopumilus sp. H13]RNJ79987.1 MAG: thiol-disulfide isomerase [Nitrosopumilus sp. H8]